MQMTDFGSADLYPPSAANNWYPSQFSSIGNTFTGLNSNLNIAGSPGHQLNTLNQLHHTSLDSATNAVLHNSPPNSASPQQTHQQTSASSQLANLSNNNGLPSLTQTTQSNHTAQQLLSPIQTVAQSPQSRSNTISLNLSTSSNSTSTNGSNNTLPSYSSQLGNGIHYPSHQFNLPSHSQFSPHSLSTHHSHTLNHLTHHHFLNNNFFPVHHTANVVSGPSSFTTPPSPSSPNNTSINSTTTAFNSLTFRPDSASSVAAMAAMSRASGLSPTENANPHHQLNGASYDRMPHSGYSFTENHGSLGRGYPSLIDHHHHSSRPAGLDSFVGLRHMPTLTNLTSNCNTANGGLVNNLDDTNVNSMFIAHHNQTLMAAGHHLNHLNHSASTVNTINQTNNSTTNLVPLHVGSTHNSVNSSSDSRHNGDDELTISCIKQEEDDDKLTVASSQFTSSNSLEHHPMSYSWVKKTTHSSSQSQAGNKR